jgi:hypothetical protein
MNQDFRSFKGLMLSMEEIVQLRKRKIRSYFDTNLDAAGIKYLFIVNILSI